MNKIFLSCVSLQTHIRTCTPLAMPAPTFPRKARRARRIDSRLGLRPFRPFPRKKSRRFGVFTKLKVFI